MAGLIVVDTCSLFDFMGGKDLDDKVEELLNSSSCAISVISVYELFRGVKSEKHIEQRQSLIKLCKVLDLTEPISKQASNIYTTLKTKGQLVCNQDIFIAATAIHWNYPFLTSNKKDFINIKQLQMY